MAKDSNKLTALGIKSLGTGKHYDGGGLHLKVEATGRKYWRYDFRIAGKPDTFAVGVYPKVTLAEARLRHAEASALVSQGINPKAHKRARQAAAVVANANTFQAVADEWMAQQKPKMAKATYDKAMWMLADLVYPWLGKRPISEIDAPELLAVIDIK